MTKYNIPARYKHAFEIFLKLNQKTITKFIYELENAPKGLLPDELSKTLSKKLDLDEIELEALIDMVFSLFGFKERYEIELKEFANGIVEALKHTKNKNLKIDENTYNRLIEVLSASGNFIITLKATDMLKERERLIMDSRIITDIRPIFNESSEVVGSIVIHNLNINYTEGEITKEIYFALDKSDLKLLKENIQKAEIEEKAIKVKYSLLKDDFIEVD